MNAIRGFSILVLTGILGFVAWDSRQRWKVYADLDSRRMDQTLAQIELEQDKWTVEKEKQIPGDKKEQA